MKIKVKQQNGIIKSIKINSVENGSPAAFEVSQNHLSNPVGGCFENDYNIDMLNITNVITCNSRDFINLLSDLESAVKCLGEVGKKVKGSTCNDAQFIKKFIETYINDSKILFDIHEH